jgi:hypothetical protein
MYNRLIDRLLTSFVEVRRAFTSIWLVAPRDLIFFQDAITDKGTDPYPSMAE